MFKIVDPLTYLMRIFIVLIHLVHGDLKVLKFGFDKRLPCGKNCLGLSIYWQTERKKLSIT